MKRVSDRLGLLVLTTSMLAACGPPAEGDGCGVFGCKEPSPGFAKFAVGSADAVRLTGVDGCQNLDLRMGQNEGSLTKVEGEVSQSDSCESTQAQPHFKFVYREHSRDVVVTDWTTAFQPLDVEAAEELIRNCTWETRPEPSALIGHWWHVNNTYAENLVLGFHAPLPYASSILPFDDENERLGKETIEGQSTIVFQNDRAKVWMLDVQKENRPVRVVGLTRTLDITFSEWELPFAAELPEPLRALSEVCQVE